MNRTTNSRLLAIVLGLLLCITAGPAAVLAAPVHTIAVLPFTLHAPKDLGYLRDGVRSMLSSRLAWEGKVEVVDSGKVDSTVGPLQNNLTSRKAREIGRKLGAEYVVYGSLTVLGQSASIDSKVVSVADGKEPVSLVSQTKTLDGLLPRINAYAQQINARLFNRKTAAGESAPAGTGSQTNRNPEALIASLEPSQGSISYLNPNFIQVTPEGALRRQGLWRSQVFKAGFIGMDSGDLDGDGQPELVALSYKKLFVFHRQQQGLKILASFTGEKVDRFVWVSLADLNHDGRDEIYLTNLRQKMSLDSASDESINPNSSQYPRVASFILEMRGSKLTVLASRQPYLLNTVYLSLGEKRLLGQKTDYPDRLFAPEISEMRLTGNRLVEGTPVSVPSYCNIFNFAMADVNNDQENEVIVITSDNRLRVLTKGGNQLWKSRKRFGATTNRLIGKVRDLRYNEIDFYYLPAPIIVADLNEDSIPELMINRSPDYTSILPQGIRYYEASEIVSLSWNQLGLVENWKSREVNGMVTSLRVADLNRDGTPDLLVSLVLGKDLMKFWQSNSVILSYSLNLTKPTPANN